MQTADERTRRLIERGLERYHRGELRDALAQWELALDAMPSSDEARALVDFARARLVGGANAFEVLPGKSIGADSTGAPVTAEEKQRRSRRTQSSPVPGLLAPLTSPHWGGAAPLPGLVNAEAAPSAVVEDEDTRPVASGRPAAPAAVAAQIAGDLALRARRQAGALIERCRAEMLAGKLAAAAVLADQALVAGDEAPSPGLGDLLDPARLLFEQVFEAHVGPADTVYAPIFALDQLGARKLDARAGFMLSRIEGPISLEQLADASGMARFDVLRGVSVLLREGALKRV